VVDEGKTMIKEKNQSIENNLLHSLITCITSFSTIPFEPTLLALSFVLPSIASRRI